MRVWVGLSGGAVAVALVAGALALAPADRPTAELADGPAASGRSTSDIEDSVAAALGLPDASLLPPAIVSPATTTTSVPARSTPTTTPRAGAAPSSTAAPSSPTTTTTLTEFEQILRDPCRSPIGAFDWEPRLAPAFVTLVNEYPGTVGIQLNFLTTLEPGQRTSTEVVPGACRDTGAVMVFGHELCAAPLTGPTPTKVFESGKRYVVTAYAGAEQCDGVARPKLRVTAA